MAELFGRTLPHISINIFLLIHFCCLMFAGIGMPINFYLMNYMVLGLGFWMISDKTNTTSSLFFITSVLATAVGDIFLMILSSNVISSTGITKFGTFMTCMNLLVKPATFLYGLSEHKRRGGDTEVSGYTNFDSDVTPTYLPDHISPPIIPGLDNNRPMGM